MKLYALCAAVTLGSTAAVAGNIFFEPQAEASVVSERPSGSLDGSGAWLIPLLAIGLVAVAFSQDDDSEEEAQLTG